MSGRTFDDLDDASQAVVQAWEQDKCDRRALAREFDAAMRQRTEQAAAELAAEKDATKARRKAEFEQAREAEGCGITIKPLFSRPPPERR